MSQDLVFDIHEPESERIVQLKLSPRNLFRFSHMPVVVTYLMGEGAILAGGALRSVIDKTPILDYDLFVNGEFAFTQMKAKLLATPGVKKVFECPNNELVSVRLGGWKIQIINVPSATDAKTLLESFDVIPSMFAWYNGSIWAHRLAIKTALRRVALVGKVTYPLATLKRLEKFKQKGYKVPSSVYKWVIEHPRDTNNPNLWRVYID